MKRREWVPDVNAIADQLIKDYRAAMVYALDDKSQHRHINSTCAAHRRQEPAAAAHSAQSAPCTGCCS